MIKNKILMFGLFTVVAVGAVGFYFSKKGNEVNNVFNVTPTIVVPTSPATNTPSSSARVPLLTSEDIVRVFFELINEKRIPEAVEMLSPSAVPDESAKQAWGVSFNHFKSVKAEKIERCNPIVPLPDYDCFKVVLNIQTDAPAEQIIWENGINIRWVNLKKVGNLWKIEGLATGP